MQVQKISLRMKFSLITIPSKIQTLNSWASMRYCIEKEMIKGYVIYGEKELRPRNNATVEQAITMLDRIAINQEWLTSSKDMHIAGFFIPSDTEMNITAGGRASYLTITAEWNDIHELVIASAPKYVCNS